MDKKYIKSPLNYTGGKYKLLSQIVPLFPKGIDTFVDLFCGGGDVAVNVDANRVIANDINENVCGLLSMFRDVDTNTMLNVMEETIAKYELSDVSKNGYDFYGCESNSGVGSYNSPHYAKMREDFNNMKVKDQNYYQLLFAIIIYSFNNQIRFNKDGKFNMPVGKRDFNKNAKEKLCSFMEKIKQGSLIVTNNDFRVLKPEKLKENDFVYCDPPYLITCASYNENNGWTENDENDLLSMLDRLNDSGIRFALSNVLENKGKKNQLLIDWSEKYNVHHLNKSYHNCNYHAKDKDATSTDEVLIINY